MASMKDGDAENKDLAFEKRIGQRLPGGRRSLRLGINEYMEPPFHVQGKAKLIYQRRRM